MTGEKKEEVVEMENVSVIEVKEFSQTIDNLCGERRYIAAFDLFKNGLNQTDLGDAASGLFYNMAPWANMLSFKYWLELVEIYTAYAREGNVQAGLSLTHQIFKKAAEYSFMHKLFWHHPGLEEQRKSTVLNELLDFLIEAFDDLDKRFLILSREANKKATLRFLIQLFECAYEQRRIAREAQENERVKSFDQLLDKIVIALAKEGYLAELSGAAGTRQNMIERLGLLVFSGNENFLNQMEKAISAHLARKPRGSSGRGLLEARRSVYLWLLEIEE